MGFTLTSYEVLKSTFAEEVVALRGKHSVAKVEDLPAHRRIQVQFLNAVMGALDNHHASLSEKARILSGFMYITLDEVTEKSTLFDGSLFRKSLIKTLGITKENKSEGTEENQIDANSAARMVNVAMKFLSSNIFEDGDSNKRMLEATPFSGVKGLDLMAFALRGIKLEAAARTQVFIEGKADLDKRIHEREEAERRLKGGTSMLGYLGSMWGSSKKKDDELSDEEPDPGKKTSVGSPV